MDIRTYMSTWLTSGELERRGDRYVGVVADVIEDRVRNKFTGEHDARPVIVFSDGNRTIPNVGMMRALAEMYGTETSTWHGKRIVVFRHRVERRNKTTGKVVARYERAVMAATDSMTPVPAIERADYDDSADALTNADIEPLTADEIFEPSRSRERKK